jgi:hypothetical protein
LASLPNLVSSVTIYQIDQEGGLTLLGNSMSKKFQIMVIYDTQTQTIQITDATASVKYYALIGIVLESSPG